MKKQNENHISSGAEKVERVEENFTQDTVDTGASPKASAGTKSKNEGTMSESKARKTTSTQGKRGTGKEEKARAKKAEKSEEASADRRVQAAKQRAAEKEEKIGKKAAVKQAKIEKKAAIQQAKLEKKQKIAEKKLARKEMVAKKKAERLENRAKRKADLKAKRVERKAEKTARRELLKNETKAERGKRLEREKKERLAVRRRKIEAREHARENKAKAREATHARRAEDKKHKREQRTERRRNGYGGWLAAVISLGTACLVLGAIVTAGAFRMNDMTVEAEGNARSTLYEMVSACEDLDDSLGKLRVSAGAGEQRRLLTNILVDTALLEASVQRVPVDSATGTDISAFLNETNAYAKSLLDRLAAGEGVNEDDMARVARLYEVNDTLYGELNELITRSASLQELFAGIGGMTERLHDLGHDGGALTDAPFADEGNIGKNRLFELTEISSAEAEELARQYFESYRIADVRYTGETVTREFNCYDFVLTDENGIEIFAQITKNGGKLLFFDTYEECMQKNFDLEECDGLARAFLKNLGIENVEAVWLSDGGMVANLTYTAVSEGVRLYPEIIRVRVCEEKGRVVGLDARGYLVNNTQYDLTHSLSRDDAKLRLAAGLVPYAHNLALIPVDGKPVLCHEFGCTYGEEEYLVYLDANTGEEVEIFRVMESARGSYLR